MQFIFFIFFVLKLDENFISISCFYTKSKLHGLKIICLDLEHKLFLLHKNGKRVFMQLQISNLNAYFCS